MTDWIIWFALAGALVVLEMFSGTFYLLMLAIGLAVGGAVAFLDAPASLQFISAAAAGIFGIYVLRYSRLGKSRDARVPGDPDLNFDVGQRLQVEYWNSDRRTARASYRGTEWDVELYPGATAEAGRFVIREIRGNRLIVMNDRQP